MKFSVDDKWATTSSFDTNHFYDCFHHYLCELKCHADCFSKLNLCHSYQKKKHSQALFTVKIISPLTICERYHIRVYIHNYQQLTSPHFFQSSGGRLFGSTVLFCFMFVTAASTFPVPSEMFLSSTISKVEFQLSYILQKQVWSFNLVIVYLKSVMILESVINNFCHFFKWDLF